MEWKKAGEGSTVTLRQKFISTDRKRWKGTGEAKRGGQLRSYSQDEFTWISDLSEEHALPEAK